MIESHDTKIEPIIGNKCLFKSGSPLIKKM